MTVDGNKSVRATFAKQAPPTAPIGPITNPINDRVIVGDLAQVDLAFRCYAPKEVFLVKLFSDVLHRPIDQASLGFSTIQFEYRAQKADGSLEAAVKSGWDLKQNKPL